MNHKLQKLIFISSKSNVQTNHKLKSLLVFCKYSKQSKVASAEYQKINK